MAYEWDTNGNQVKKAEGTKTMNFVYDSDNRLVEVKDQGNNLIARYGYDLLSRRAWKEQYRDKAGQALSQAKRIYYLYSDEGLIAEATQAIGSDEQGRSSATEQPAITTQYGPRPNSEFTTGTLFVKTKNSKSEDTIAYYQHNHLHTPIQATDKNGNVVWAAGYNPFGQATIITSSPTTDKPTITSNLRLPGQYEDQETRLHYNWNRYYEPQSGRFFTQDLVNRGRGESFYVYARASPLKYFDANGLEWRVTKSPQENSSSSSVFCDDEQLKVFLHSDMSSPSCPYWLNATKYMNAFISMRLFLKIQVFAKVIKIDGKLAIIRPR